MIKRESCKLCGNHGWHPNSCPNGWGNMRWLLPAACLALSGCTVNAFYSERSNGTVAIASNGFSVLTKSKAEMSKLEIPGKLIIIHAVSGKNETMPAVMWGMGKIADAMFPAARDVATRASDNAAKTAAANAAASAEKARAAAEVEKLKITTEAAKPAVP